MPPKKKKFESTFPAARIKKIMQLDDDVGRVASSVPVVISRAVEIFLHSLLTRAAAYAESRNAKTLTVTHLKHCIQLEKQWDFLKELTSKIADVTAEQEEAEESYVPKRGRKRRTSPTVVKPAATGPRKKLRPLLKKEESSESEDSPQLTPNISNKSPSVSVGYVLPQSVSQPADPGTSGLVSSITSGLSRTVSQDNNSDDDYD